MVKLLSLMFVLLGPPSFLYGKDFGVQGSIGSIEEIDSRELIIQKLKSLEASGELQRHQEELQKRTKAAVNRPRAVEGITKAHKRRVYTYDPSYLVPYDIKDHKGKVFAKKGTRINPLETVSLSHALIFFDGDDEEQKDWALNKLKELNGKAKLILTKGAPLELSKEIKAPVYFDQEGLLTKKLNIKHVPAEVSQEGFALRIEEIPLGELHP